MSGARSSRSSIRDRPICTRRVTLLSRPRRGCARSPWCPNPFRSPTLSSGSRRRRSARFAGPRETASTRSSSRSRTGGSRRPVERYFDEASKTDWPDRLDRGEFKYPYDAEKRRGCAVGRWVHIVDKGVGDREKFLKGLQMQWDWYGSFGFALALVEPGDPVPDLNERVDPEWVIEKKGRARRHRRLPDRGDPEHARDHPRRRLLVHRLLRDERTERGRDRRADAGFRRGGHAGAPA